MTRKLTDELTPLIRDEVGRGLEAKIRKETKAALIPIIEAELTPRLTAEIEAELTPRIEESVRGRLEKTLRRSLRRDLEPEVREQLTPLIAEEQKRKLAPVIRAQIEEEVTEALRREERKAAEAELRKARQAIRAEVEQEMKQKLRKQLEIERDGVRDDVKRELRGEMEETIRENVRLELTPILTKQLRKTLINERQFADLFVIICEANGTEGAEFSMAAFFEECGRLAADVVQLRKAFGIESGPFLRFFSDMQFENSHLDQLHTQTRALLVRQAQMIAELRELAQMSSWNAWARKIYWLINREDVASDDVAEVRKAVEESIAQIVRDTGD